MSKCVAFFHYLTNGFLTRCSLDFYNLTGHQPTFYYSYVATKGRTGEPGLHEVYQGNLWKEGVDVMKDMAK